MRWNVANPGFMDRHAGIVSASKLGKMGYTHDCTIQPYANLRILRSQSNQLVLGFSRAYLQIDLSVSLLTFSTCSFALGQQLDTKRSVVPKPSPRTLKDPMNSQPESYLNQQGFLILGMSSLYKHVAKVVDRLSGKGIISSHLPKLSTEITQWP